VSDFAPRPKNDGEQVIAASEATRKYCNSAGAYLEKVGAELMAAAEEVVRDSATTAANVRKVAEDVMRECSATAASVRQVGELQSARLTTFFERARDVLRTVEDVRKTIALPLISTEGMDVGSDAVERAIGDINQAKEPAPAPAELL
jgi:hypothetical protein